MQQRSLQQVRVSVFLFFLIHGLIIATWASRIPAFQAHLHLSPAVLGRSLMMAAVKRELATAYEKVGAVQGDYLDYNLGDSEGTLASYRKELDLRKNILPPFPAIGKTASIWRGVTGSSLISSGRMGIREGRGIRSIARSQFLEP